MSSTPVAIPTLEPRIAAALRADGRRVVITGAGGWLGMATLELLDQALGAQAQDRVQCFGSSHRTLTLRNGREFSQRPLADLATLDPQPSLVLHYAFLTKDRADAMSDEDYVLACRSLDETVIGALDRIGADGVFVASSGAATKVADEQASRGMRLYGTLKLEQERLFADWGDRADKRVVIGRLFNMSGPYINKLSSYALSAFILDAQAGRPVTVAATRPVVRGYIAIRELVSLVLSLLFDRPAGIALFETGGEAMEMARIAACVCETMGTSSVERAVIESDLADNYVGDDNRYRALLASQAIESVPFAQQISETADFLAFSGRDGDPAGLVSTNGP